MEGYYYAHSHFDWAQHERSIYSLGLASVCPERAVAGALARKRLVEGGNGGNYRDLRKSVLAEPRREDKWQKI
ncbi:MAG: hypothetical protein HQ553_09560 [Chloroflexi bacterium]|nr:hypothetical protein [Chloroflexota bacterium]